MTSPVDSEHSPSETLAQTPLVKIEVDENKADAISEIAIGDFSFGSQVVTSTPVHKRTLSLPSPPFRIGGEYCPPSPTGKAAVSNAAMLGSVAESSTGDGVMNDAEGTTIPQIVFSFAVDNEEDGSSSVRLADVESGRGGRISTGVKVHAASVESSSEIDQQLLSVPSPKSPRSSSRAGGNGSPIRRFVRPAIKLRGTGSSARVPVYNKQGSPKSSKSGCYHRVYTSIF